MTSSREPAPPRRIRQYEFADGIARGGMTVVYRARREALKPRHR